MKDNERPPLQWQTKKSITVSIQSSTARSKVRAVNLYDDGVKSRKCSEMWTRVQDNGGRGGGEESSGYGWCLMENLPEPKCTIVPAAVRNVST